MTAHSLLLRRSEVAKLLNVSERTVETMKGRGDLPIVRLANRTVRYPREAIMAFVEARTIR
jgi:excisionase family DNA binding protein